MPEPIEKQSKDNPISHIPPEKRWQPGQSGNPSGRPKGICYFGEAAREMLASQEVNIEYTFPKGGEEITRKFNLKTSAKSFHHAIIAAMMRECLDGNVQAFTALSDRAYGKPAQSLDVTSDGDKIQSTNFILSDPAMRDKIQALHDKVINDEKQDPVSSGADDGPH
jgi:hypothetical protein